MILKFEDFQLLEKLITFDGKVYPQFNNIVILAGGAGCFTEETLVNTENGNKKISEIEIGEKVWTINELTLEKELKTVQDVFTFNNREDIIELELENGEIIRCTEDHEFFVDGEWIKAKDLEYVEFKD